MGEGWSSGHQVVTKIEIFRADYSNLSIVKLQAKSLD